MQICHFEHSFHRLEFMLLFFVLLSVGSARCLSGQSLGGLLAESLGTSTNLGVITFHHHLDSLEIVESNTLVH